MATNPFFQYHLPRALDTGIKMALSEIIVQKSYSDKAVAQMLKKNTAWGSRDRRISTSTVYDIARNFIFYQYLIENLEELKSTENENLSAWIFLSLYFRPDLKIPIEIDEALSQKLLSTSHIPKHILDSFPKWLYDELEEDWKESAAIIIQSLQRQAPVYIRINTLKTNTKRIFSVLNKMKIPFQEVAPFKNAIRILGNNQLRRTQAFNMGWFEFQDIGSQYILHQVGIKSDITVIDFCAGKGGKTLQLADMMKNTGKIFASDIDEDRLKVLEKRVSKSGVKNVSILSNKDLLIHKNLHADIIIIDAPCSGTGTLRRQADIAFRLEENQVHAIVATQKEILNNSVSYIKAGGKLVYITCSLLKKENSEQIHSFLLSHNNFQLIREEYILPDTFDGDGFYFAILTKKA